jgi:hypothetical protein
MVASVISRLLRLVALAAAAAGVTAAIRALSSRHDPLPAPAEPSGGPWPPLRNETEAPVVPEAPPPTEAAEPTPRPPSSPAVAPEPGGVPVSEETSGSGPAAAWVAPAPDGSCPDGHPVKAKTSSGIFHSPGQMNYDRTAPDRCYVDAAAAEADGLRAAKR